MRKTSKLLFLVLLLFAFFSCKDDDDEGFLRASSSTLRFPGTSNQLSLVVESNVPFEDIKATSVADWVFAEAKPEVKQFLVTVPANPGTEGRSAILTLRAGNSVLEIDVLQEAGVSGFELTAENGKCWDVNMQVPIGIKTKQAWTATITGGDWFQLDTTAGVGDACIIAYFFPNTLPMERRGEVTVKAASGDVRVFSFTQSAALPELGRKGDSLALVAIYNKFQGNANWDNWCVPGLSLEHWTGVHVNEHTKRVERLFLTKDYKCEGGEDFPEEIKNLTALKEFSCAGNGYSGKVPYALLRCPLTALNFSDCSLQGTLEPWIGSFPNDFSYLKVYNTKLTGELPYELRALWGIEHILLEYNELMGELPACWDMKLLRVMMLEYNHLSGRLPENMGEMRLLSKFSFSGNTEMTGEFPEKICQMITLGYINEYGYAETDLTGCIK